MEFLHIAPTAYLDELNSKQRSHLILAHLVESDQTYRQWYHDHKTKHPNRTYILDNSAFELYKQGKEMYPADKLVEMGKQVKADYIVLPDYPGQALVKTQMEAGKYIPIFKEAGFGTFFCPQTEIGDPSDEYEDKVHELMDGYYWAGATKDIDYVGFSILAIPNAYGVERGNNLQRYLSRFTFIKRLAESGTLDYLKSQGKLLHLLGMVDGPNEIALLSPWLNEFDTWDSSAAVWAGLNNIKFDYSPTGMVNGKFEKHVDFDQPYDESYLQIAKDNIDYINRQIIRETNQQAINLDRIKDSMLK